MGLFINYLPSTRAAQAGETICGARRNGSGRECAVLVSPAQADTLKARVFSGISALGARLGE